MIMTAVMAAAGFAAIFAVSAGAAEPFEKDIFPTSEGDVEVTFIGHGSLMMRFGGKVIHVDPFSQLTDYGKLPKADVVLLTHDHQDHLSPALDLVRTGKTTVVASASCAGKVSDAIIMKNGESRTVAGIGIEAVPAYNIVHKRPDGAPFHPKGEGNGYVLTFGKTRVYVAGDTENTPEVKALKDVDYAFLPMNLPYTMTPEMAADAAKGFRPKVLYPYHYGESDTGRLVALMKDSPEVEVRIRRMK